MHILMFKKDVTLFQETKFSLYLPFTVYHRNFCNKSSPLHQNNFWTVKIYLAFYQGPVKLKSILWTERKKGNNKWELISTELNYARQWYSYATNEITNTLEPRRKLGQANFHKNYWDCYDRGTGKTIDLLCPTIVCRIVTEDTPVSYWSIDLFTDTAAILN